ncbi:uncharacterized protein LOC122500807 [Leptopilina heterotoma]|uniref:uncharacterized protein LOC122500807 n=1 Tax=Leptopilina heterotoma TaxID=63436 RepID=UPI001CA8A90C|nr:uncharacterized protein LOC122500807 [Leptopilina heterotoma]
MNVKVTVLFLTCLLVMRNFNKSSLLNVFQKMCKISNKLDSERASLVIENNKQFNMKVSDKFYNNSVNDIKNFNKITENPKSIPKSSEVSILITFYNYVRNKKISELFTIWPHITDDLNVIPFMNEITDVEISILFGFSTILIQHRLNQFICQKSVHPMISISQVIITTEIVTKLLKLVTKPAMANINISTEKRNDLYKRFFWQRYKLIDLYLNKVCNESTAMGLLRSYAFSTPKVMTNFASNLKDCKSPPFQYKSFKLQNFDYYEKLRFNLHVEHWLTKQQAIQRISNIYSQEEISFINIPLGELFNDYLANNLFDAITFDDYYAIKSLLSNPQFINDKESFIYCQIMKAVHRLAIRQFDARPQRNNRHLPKYIYCYIGNWKIGRTSYAAFDDLTLCYKDNVKWDSIDQKHNLLKLNKYITKTYLKIEIFELYLIVDLKIFIKNSKYYLILPQTFIDMKRSANILIGEERVNLLHLNSDGIRHSHWLADNVNMALEFEKKCNRNSKAIEKW